MTVETSLIIEILCAFAGVMLALYDIFTDWEE